MWKLKIRPLPQNIQSTAMIASPKVIHYKAPDLSRSTIWGRLAVTGGSLGFGVAVLGISAASFQYRLSYFSVENAIINGSTIDLRSPADGSISAFEVKTGQEVQAGQVLAKIKPLAINDTLGVKLQGELDVLRSQQHQIQQTLSLLNTQLRGLDQQEFQFTAQQQQLTAQGQSVNTAKVSAATLELDQHQAQIESAMAQAKAARVDYDRYAALAKEGGISEQKVSQVRAIWESAEAEVARTKAAQLAAAASIETLQEEAPVPLLTASHYLQNQRINLMQAVQDQTASLNRLATEIAAKQTQLKAEQAVQTLRSLDINLQAPSDGKVFQTNSNMGEQVNRSTPLMTVVDCKNRWIEAFVPSEQATRFNRSKPVNVQISGKPEALSGQIESINGVNPDELKRQSQAVFPIVPANLSAQMPMRVVVKLKDNQDIPATQNMCGIGQSVKLTFST